MISAKIVADSISPYGDRLTSMLVTFPRYILAELNTHRVLTKNSASSRAIPFKKMREAVLTNPFIPVAWQKDHSGMQGSEYFTENEDASLNISADWLEARNEAVTKATELHQKGVTKQMVNRLLEPFMWHTVLITASDWDNFFELRCPQYSLFSENMPIDFKSRKDLLKYVHTVEAPEFKNQYDDLTDLDWLKLNRGQADIHMMLLAEAMFDARNGSTPKYLQAGGWHIPFENTIYEEEAYRLELPLTDDDIDIFGDDTTDLYVKISTGMCARTSYTVVGEEKEFGYDKQIQLHDRMANQVPFHASPFEHNARVMTQREYDKNPRCRNFNGFIQYRHLLENKNA